MAVMKQAARLLVKEAAVQNKVSGSEKADLPALI